MSSTGSSPSSPPSLEEMSTRGATALLLPWILGMAAATNSTPREVAVFVHQPTRSITLIEGSLDIESLLREMPGYKEGPLPASKASIESLPIVHVAEPGLDCAICLSEYEVNGEVKEMPCRHRFHAGCIDRWLGMRGSCPVCRFAMPVEEVEKKESTYAYGADSEGEMGGWRIHVFFARSTGSDPGDSDPEGGGNGSDELPAQENMMIDDDE